MTRRPPAPADPRAPAHAIPTGFAYLRSPDGKPIAMAHRGGAKNPELIGHENTMRAFQHAVDLGYRWIETDVHATRDGVLLAFHDHTLDRVTDGTGRIRDLDFARVATARIGGAEPIPVFAEVLATFPEIRFNIDVKAPNAVAPLVDLITTADARDRICVSSFSQRRIAQVRSELGPSLCTGLGPVEISQIRLGPRVLDRFVRGACLQISERYESIRLLTPTLVERAHAQGLQVHVWTVDYADDMHRLLDAGVDGLITDRTDILRDVLIERGQW